MNTMKKIKANQKGFTLVELIVVVAILGVLAAVAAPNYMNYLYKSRVNADISSARAIVNAARTMFMTTNESPSLSDVLSDADMSNTIPACCTSGTTFNNIITLTYGEIDGTKQFQAVLDLSGKEKAGKYAGSYTIKEFGDLQQAKEGGYGTND